MQLGTPVPGVHALRQITVHLDEPTAERMARAAKADGVSKSRWIAKLIRRETADEWPDSVKALSGAWADDFPAAGALRADLLEDPMRGPL